MKERKLILVASFIGGFSLSIAILFFLITENVDSTISTLIILGTVLNAIGMGLFIRSKLKNN